jgi:proteasome accessory factor A
MLVEEHAAGDPEMARALDLQYSLIDPDDSLYDGLAEAGLVERFGAEEEIRARMEEPAEPTRAWARSIAVRRLRPRISAVTWSRIEFDQGAISLELEPDRRYPEALGSVETVEDFAEVLQTP